MTLEAIIFDVDGTLAETEELHREAFNITFARAGLDWSWDQELYGELLKVEGGLERMRAYVERFRPRDLARLDNEDAFRPLHRAKSGVYLSLIEGGGLQLRSGVGRLLTEAMAAGVKIGICTSSQRENFEALILNRFGFEALDWFSAVVTGGDVAAKKPDPAPYLATLDALGVAPHAAFAIEDNTRGVASARAAGLPVIATPGLYSRGEDFSAANIVLSDLGGPNTPFRVLAGDPGDWHHVSVEALEEWRNPANRASVAA